MAKVTNQSELQQALDLSDPLIDILNDFTIESQIRITYPVTIQSSSGPWTLKRLTGLNSNMILVAAGGNLTMQNLIIDGDKANTPKASSAVITISELKMVNVTIQNNATQLVGGGLRIEAGDAAVTLDRCTFQNCQCDREGAGIYCVGSSPTLTDCSFIGNVTPDHGGGGGISCHGGNPTLTRCTFIGNVADSGGGIMTLDFCVPTLNDCVFMNNRAVRGDGGAIWANHSNSGISGCAFLNNSGGQGGAVMLFFEGSCTFSNCIFLNNTAYSGGAVCGELFGPSVTGYDNCTFRGNTARESGGAILGSIGNSRFVGCDFAHNTAPYGGGICSDFINLTLDQCTFVKNSASLGGAIGKMRGTVTIRDTGFYHNTASDSGGGIYVQEGIDGKGTLYFRNSVTEGNSAGDSGAGIFITVEATMGLSGPVFIRDGVCLESGEKPIQVEGSLAGAAIALERSPYVNPDPAKAPIDIAVATEAYPILTDADKAAFQMPSPGFEAFYICLGKNDTRVRIDELKQYAITYRNLKGAYHPNPTVYDALTLPITLLPPCPVEGCHFAGWVDRDGGRVAEIPAGSTGDITLFARWGKRPRPCRCPICCQNCCCTPCRCYCCFPHCCAPYDGR